MEERDAVSELVSKAENKNGIAVTIGVDNDTESENVCNTAQLSLLSSTYSAGKFKGSLGIIGPVRMPYSKLVKIVDFTAKKLSQILSE